MMSAWFWYAIAAAILYGLHQVFTKLAAERIGDGLGGFVVEASAAVSILGRAVGDGELEPAVQSRGAFYAVLTGVCVGAGTIAFFLLFQKGGPLSAVPAILAGGAVLTAVVGILLFKESPSWRRLLGIALSIAGLVWLKR